MDPARMFRESLTLGPELENSQGQNLPSRPTVGRSGMMPKADLAPMGLDDRF
jgi:hypothetical protein